MFFSKTSSIPFSPHVPFCFDFPYSIFRALPSSEGSVGTIFIFIVVNRAHANDFRIERRRVVFLCWMRDLNPGSQTPGIARWQTDWAMVDQAKNFYSTARPYEGSVGTIFIDRNRCLQYFISLQQYRLTYWLQANRKAWNITRKSLPLPVWLYYMEKYICMYTCYG